MLGGAGWNAPEYLMPFGMRELMELISFLFTGSSELACFYDSGVTLFCTWIPDGTLTEVPCQLHAELQDPSPDHWYVLGMI